MQKAGWSFGPGGFRLILALAVVFSHLTAFKTGGCAVMLFFILSGYWVLRMYDQKYLPKKSVWRFYLSRALRIWGPFSVAFLLVFLLFYISPEPKSANFLTGLGLLGIATSKMDVLGTSWSLDVEMQFYLLVPVISVLLARCVGLGHFLLAGLLVIALAAVGSYLQGTHGLITVLYYLPMFFTGALIWVLKLKASPGLARAGIVAFVVVAAVVLAVPYLRPLLREGSPVPFSQTWFTQAWILLLVPFVIRNLQQKSSALDMHFGNYSYALYITHWPVIALWRVYFGPLEVTDKAMVLCVIAVVSILFYLMVDRPLERLRAYVMWRVESPGRAEA